MTLKSLQQFKRLVCVRVQGSSDYKLDLAGAELLGETVRKTGCKEIWLDVAVGEDHAEALFNGLAGAHGQLRIMFKPDQPVSDDEFFLCKHRCQKFYRRLSTLYGQGDWSTSLTLAPHSGNQRGQLLQFVVIPGAPRCCLRRRVNLCQEPPHCWISSDDDDNDDDDEDDSSESDSRLLPR